MPEPTIVKITYEYDTLSYETYVEAGSKVVLESDPFYIAGKKIVKYTNGAQTYLAGQLITAPNSDVVLTVPSNGGLEDIGHVKIHQDNNVIDVSNTVINIVEKKGKNQPFSYVVLTVLKELFNNLELTLIQKSTIFDIDVYGITGAWTYERLEDNGSTYDITIVNRAYYLKTITLASLLGYTISGSTITFTGLPNVQQAEPIDWDDTSTNTTYGTVLFGLAGGSQDLSLTIKRVNTAATGATPEYQYSIIKLSGNPDSIFRFIVTAVTGITDFRISTGDYYSVNPSTSYTTSQIEYLSPTSISPSQDIFNTISLRLDQYCWNVIEIIGLLTNRFAFFYGDCANLKSFPKNYDKNIIVDWEQPSNLTSNDEYRPVLALSANDDQGSQYVLASQKVACEAFETTVSISNTNSTDVGADIVFASPDNTKINVSETDNTIRDTQARIIALNALKRYYRPGDCIKYSICESVYPQYSSVFSSLSDIPAPSSEDQCVVYRTTLGAQIILNETYFVAKQNGANLVWVEWNTDDVTREPAYSVDTCAKSVEDRQNNIIIPNVPVALVETEYPACVTTYTWGMPEFMDEQSQFRDLTAVAQEAVLDNTSDTQISSSDASKIVVGNQSISDLKSDRSGFTGLILEKNVDNQVYRLAGYNMGELQAEFNSLGEIQSGGDPPLVKINSGGITLNGGVDIILDENSSIYANHIALDSNGLTSYRDVNTTSEGINIPIETSPKLVAIRDDGNISVGNYGSAPSLKLGNITIGTGEYALVSYNGSNPVSYITRTGQIVSGDTLNGWTVMDNSGFRLYTQGANPTLSGVSRNPLVWVDSTGYHLSNALSSTSMEQAEVTYGDWAHFVDGSSNIKASVNLLSNVNLNVGPVCKDTSGTIYYSTVLSQTGLKTYSYTYGGTQSAATNVVGTVQCSIDNNGVIIAGAGCVKLDGTGLKTYNNNNVMQCSVTTGGSFEAGGAVLNRDGITINYDGSTSLISADALKFYDTNLNWSPYKLYATYNSSTNTATSTVLAESKKNNGVITNPSKLKMVVDGGGVTGVFTPFNTNATATNTNIGTVVIKSYQNTNWEGTPTISTASSHQIAISNTNYSYEIYVELTDTDSPSVTITTPTSPDGDSYYTDCAFIAYMANNTSFQFKSYNDNGSSARGTRYVFASESSPVVAVGIRVKGATNSVFYLDYYPINIYISSGDGASILLDQVGTIIQGNNTINGQLYQSGGPIYFKGAGQNIPAYFDMPIVPLAVISQGTVSGASVVSRNVTLNSFVCRNIYIDTTAPSSAQEGDIFLQLPS